MPVPFAESAEVARAIVAEVLGPEMSVGTWLQAAQTSEGADAIRLVVVFPNSRVSGIAGDKLIEIMGRIKETLPQIGEDRFPIISFARMDDEPELKSA